LHCRVIPFIIYLEAAAYLRVAGIEAYALTHYSSSHDSEFCSYIEDEEKGMKERRE